MEKENIKQTDHNSKADHQKFAGEFEKQVYPVKFFQMDRRESINVRLPKIRKAQLGFEYKLLAVILDVERYALAVNFGSGQPRTNFLNILLLSLNGRLIR
jgi:hypothetical protein